MPKKPKPPLEIEPIVHEEILRKARLALESERPRAASHA